MAARHAKTAQKRTTETVPVCPACSGSLQAVRLAGSGHNGMFWVCENQCGFNRRTR
jgi:hypothetical protein